MRTVFLVVAILAFGLAACATPEPPIIPGGPTTSEAIRAVLNNPRILPRDAVASELRNVRLDATHCSMLPRGEVSCHVRLYSLGRGWSAVTPGRFVKGDQGWAFSF
ncbi:MAG: hypothetical protein KIS86_08660 [Devosia sp.]|nr:hypothetical protein [Devosia sp.]